MIFSRTTLLICALTATAIACPLRSVHAAQIDGHDYYVSAGDTPKISLSRKPVVKYSIQVTVNDTAQVETLDYTCDSDNATVTFLHALNVNDVVKITYSFDDQKSKLVASSINSPVSIGLMNAGGASINANLQYQQNQDGLTGNMGGGLSGAWKNSGGESLTGSLAYKPGDATVGGLSTVQTNIANTFAKKLGSTSFAAQTNYTNATESSQTVANALNMTSAVNRWFSLNGLYKTTNILNNDSTATNKDEMQIGAAINSLKPDKYVSISGSATRSESDSTDSASTQTDKLDMTTTYTPSKPLMMQVKAAQTVTGDTVASSQSVSTDLTTSKTTKLSAAVAVASTVTPTSVAQSQTISSSLAASNTTKLGASLATTSSGSDGSVSKVQAFSLAAAPSSILSLNGDYKTRETIDCGTSTPGLETLTTKATYKLAKPLTITGAYAEHPDDSGSPLEIFRRAVAISSQFGSLSLSTNYTIETPTGDSTSSPTEKLGLTGALALSSHTTVSGGYSDSNLLGYAGRTRNYSFGLSHNMGSTLKISLSGTMNVPDEDQPSVTNATAAIGLKF